VFTTLWTAVWAVPLPEPDRARTAPIFMLLHEDSVW
jgi:hypothetical protein